MSRKFRAANSVRKSIARAPIPIKPIEWFVENGCELTRPSMEIFRAVYGMSGQRPCVECNCKDTCPAWPKIAS